MRWNYSYDGSEPVIMDLPVYDSSYLNNGELMMKGASANNTADGGTSLITAAGGTANTDGTDAVGILNESTYSALAADRVNDDSSGVYLGKVIINPGAVYLCEYANGTSYDVTVESGSSTIKLNETVTANSNDGYHILMVNCATAGLDGNLRMVTATTSTTSIAIAALEATPTTSDSYIYANPCWSYPPGLVSGDGRYMNCLFNAGGIHTTYSEAAVMLKVILSYAWSSTTGYVPLVSYTRSGTVNLGSGAKLFCDLTMLNHIFSPGD